MTKTSQSTRNYLSNLKQSDNEVRERVAQKYSFESFENFEIFKQHKKLYARFKLIVSNDNFYEADQLYKTVHFRCMTNNLVDEALAIIFNGIYYFSAKNSFHCAFDLSKVFVETLKKSNKKSLDTDLKYKIKIIHELLGKNKSQNDDERNEFTVTVLKWSSNLFKKIKLDSSSEENIQLNYQSVFGHYDLHREFAINNWKERNYIQARYHFLHSLDAESLAHMLIECHLNFAYPSEYDFMVTQAVLQYLSLRNVKCAMDLLQVYTKNHPKVVESSIENTVCYESPLLNFVHFLILSIKENKLKSYKAILEAYTPSINCDPSFYSYIERIGEYFFNIKKKRAETGGMFSNLMRMLTSSNNGPTDNEGPASMLKSESENEQDDFEGLKDLEDDDVLD